MQEELGLGGGVALLDAHEVMEAGAEVEDLLE